MIKSSGPIIEPCGTPHGKRWHSDVAFAFYKI